MPTLVFVHGGVSGRPKPTSLSLAHSPAGSANGDGALDTVERSVRRMEDDPALNAGWGSVLNRDGALELDAGIADGATGRFGGVLGVSGRYPITLARRVLEDTPHVLLTGAGAMALAGDMETLQSTTEEQLERFRRARSNEAIVDHRYGEPEHVDTVGAVACDDWDRLAAGSSTGGVFGKMPGRVGDSCVFGAGTYASPSAAVVGTGVGEVFLETLAARRVGELIESGDHPQEACERVVEKLGERAGTPAGLLALDNRRRMGAAYRGGSWAVAGPDGPVIAKRLP
jgi:beta-aspartyl-peptidase (threonine type)